MSCSIGRLTMIKETRGVDLARPSVAAACPSVCQRTARDDRVLRLSRGMIYKAGDLRTALWRRRSTPCLSPIAPRTSSLAVQTQRRRLPLAPLKGASPLFLENRRGDGPSLPSSNPPSSVMLAGQLLGINPQTPAQVALAPSSRPKPPPMPVAPCMSGGRGRIPDRESQGSQQLRRWREQDSNSWSRRDGQLVRAVPRYPLDYEHRADAVVSFAAMRRSAIW